MELEDELTNSLAEALRTIDFDTRYYDFYAKVRQSEKPTDSSLKKADWERVLATTDERFRYDAKERFFASERSVVGACTTALHVSFRYDRATFILSVRTARGTTGGPFSLLAEVVGLLRDPKFTPDPPYPTLPFSNAEQLGEVVRFAVGLYADAVRALGSSALCKEER